MILNELKTVISERTGMPASLLTGQTAEEIISQARALLELKSKNEVERPKSTREQFAEWLSIKQGEVLEDPENAALSEIAEAVRVENGGYPVIPDGGEVTGLPDPRPAWKQFEEWFNHRTAFNPLKSYGGVWENIKDTDSLG